MDRSIKRDDVVLITGGGGYLGSKLAERLLPIGCKVYLVDISFNDISRRVEEQNQHILCEFLNLTDKDAVMKFILAVKPVHIFHFASIIDRRRDFTAFEKILDVNLYGTFNLLESLTAIDYRTFCFASTSEIYGSWNGKAFRETDSADPKSPYSLTKLYAETFIKLFSGINNKPFKILRIFNFLGIDMPPTTFIGQMIDSYKKGEVFKMTRGEQSRDYLPVSELLEQILFVSASNSSNNIVNICSGQSFKMIDVVTTFKSIVKSEFVYDTNNPYRENEVWETRGDVQLLKSVGYSPVKHDIESLLSSCRNI